jgi:2Fe-2S iron-sulfur cluster binding domain
VTATREDATRASAGTSPNEKRGMNLTLRIWRQKNPSVKGKMVTYKVTDISPDMSFLEMLDVVNEGLIAERKDPIAFDSDCREGICGTCGFLINGVAHGPDAGTTVCQLHMRRFKDSDRVVLEPWRAKAFPVVKDLVVDRSAFDRIIQAGGYTRRTPITSSFQGTSSKRRWIQLPVSAAERAWPLARTLQQRFLRRRRSVTCRCFRRDRSSANGGWWRWSIVTMPKDSAAVRTRASARRSARRESQSLTSRA